MEANTKGILTLTKWILFVTLGWIIGLILGILIADPLGKIKLEFFGLGLGIATGIGLMQWLVLGRYTSIDYKWLSLMLVGMGSSFLLFDIIIVIIEAIDSKYKMDGIPAMIIMTLAVAMGGFVTGLLQSRLLKKNNFTNTGGWIFYSFLTWTFCSVFLSVYVVCMNNIFHIMFTTAGKLMNLVAFFLIGPIFGYISGKKLLTILRER